MCSTNKPTIPELNTSLKDLVEWTEFALYLPGLQLTDIKMIKDNTRYVSTVDQKLALYDKWLHAWPDACWEDVVTGLERVGENTMARQLRQCHCSSRKRALPALQELNGVSRPIADSTRPPPSKRASLENPEGTDVSEKLVTELDSLQHSFLGLAHNVKLEVENKTRTSDLHIKLITRHLQEERAYPIASLETVATSDQLFKAIHPHYNFLNCYLIVSIAIFLSGIIAEKAREYRQSVDTFMKGKAIKELRNVLKRYYNIFRGSSDTDEIEIVEVTVENGWGQQSIWLVEVLVKTLFRLKYSDELVWCDIVPGSVVISLVASKHITSSLIENAMDKAEFMGLMGIMSLKVGDRIVWKKDDEDTNVSFSFEQSLIHATLIDNMEAIQFLVQNALADVNTKNTTVKLTDTNQEMYESESDVMNVLKSFYATFNSIFDDAMREAPQPMNKTKDHDSDDSSSSNAAATGDRNITAPRIEACNNFLNGRMLAHHVQHSEALSERLARYNKMNDGYMKSVLLLYLHKPLLQYLPAPFPGSIEVIVTLHSAWSACSAWYFEKLGQMVFAPILFQQNFQLFRVDTCSGSELVRVVLLADGESMSINFMKECLCNDHMLITLLGIVSVRIGDTDVVTDYSSIRHYTFNDAIDQAKAIGNDKIVELLLQIRQSPVDFIFTSADSNNNRCFIPDPDSTPLMIACCNDNSQLVQLLLDHNADPNVQTRDGITALMYSAGNRKIFQLLLDRGADINQVDAFDETPMHYASKAGNVKVIEIILAENRYLVNVTNDDGETPLYFASENGHEIVVDKLLLAKADPNIQSMEGNTALKIASNNGHINIVRRLHEHANPNLQNTEGRTALMDACSEGHVEIAEMLLRANADMTLRSDEGLTALEYASTNGHHDVIDVLEAATI